MQHTVRCHSVVLHIKDWETESQSGFIFPHCQRRRSCLSYYPSHFSFCDSVCFDFSCPHHRPFHSYSCCCLRHEWEIITWQFSLFFFLSAWVCLCLTCMKIAAISRSYASSLCSILLFLHCLLQNCDVCALAPQCPCASCAPLHWKMPYTHAEYLFSICYWYNCSLFHWQKRKGENGSLATELRLLSFILFSKSQLKGPKP